jgi:DHA1 family multidrug resistance protein-like MFS transporter
MTSSLERTQRVPGAILAAAFLFNLGQGVLRPAMPLYLQRTFSANYRMVTLIPVVFGAGKWIANMPTGYLLDRLGRPLMVAGLMLIALIDVLSVMTQRFDIFLGLRALGGLGWAMFATVATTATVSVPTPQRRGRGVGLLLMSETAGLLLGSAAGGWLYQGIGVASPFLFEAACMVVAALTVLHWTSLAAAPSRRQRSQGRRVLSTVLHTPGVVLMGVTSALLTAVQVGVLVFLFPLYLVTRAGLNPKAVGTVVSLSVLGRLMALWLGGTVSDRWGRMRVLIPGLLVYAALLAGTSQLTGPILLGICSFGIGATAGFVAAVPTALTSDQVDPSHQGIAIGWLRTMSDSGQIVGPLVMGALADAMDLSAPFLMGAALLAGTAWQCHSHARAMAAASAEGVGHS